MGQVTNCIIQTFIDQANPCSIITGFIELVRRREKQDHHLTWNLQFEIMFDVNFSKKLNFLGCVILCLGSLSITGKIVAKI